MMAIEQNNSNNRLIITNHIPTKLTLTKAYISNIIDTTTNLKVPTNSNNDTSDLF